jgi:putative SOS response-associated peptidase YedK
MRWGLIPHYAEERPGFQPIHAPAETIFQQRIFCDAYGKRRCIVPMSQFHQKDARRKRHTISRGDRELLPVSGRTGAILIRVNGSEPLRSLLSRPTLLLL